MKYRILGRTGLRVSVIGLGGHEYRRWLPGNRDMEHFVRTQPERNKLVGRAIDVGINYFDTTFLEEAESLGRALKTLGVRRDDIYISAMIVGLFKKLAENDPSTWQKIITDGVEERLRLLNTDYVDTFRVCMPEEFYSPGRLKATLEVLQEFKEEGKAHSIGASSHQPRFLAELIRRYDCFDTVMVRYNYHLHEVRENLFPLTKALDVGVVIMKPFAWPYYGIPFTRFGPIEGEKGLYTAAQTSLRWILDCPEVATVAPGINNVNELEEGVRAVTEDKNGIDEELLERHLKVAQGPQARAKLRAMLNAPDADIRHYAEQALKQMKGE